MEIDHIAEMSESNYKELSDMLASVLKTGERKDVVNALKELEGSNQPKPSSKSDSDSDKNSRALVTAD